MGWPFNGMSSSRIGKSCLLVQGVELFEGHMMNKKVAMCLTIVLLVSFFAKDSLVVLKQGLDGDALLLNIGKFALYIHGPHNSRCKDNSKIERSHLQYTLADGS